MILDTMVLHLLVWNGLLVLLSWPWYFKGHRIFLENHIALNFLMFLVIQFLLHTSFYPNRTSGIPGYLCTCCVTEEGGLEIAFSPLSSSLFWGYRCVPLWPGLFPGDGNQAKDFEWWRLGSVYEQPTWSTVLDVVCVQSHGVQCLVLCVCNLHGVQCLILCVCIQRGEWCLILCHSIEHHKDNLYNIFWSY